MSFTRRPVISKTRQLILDTDVLARRAFLEATTIFADRTLERHHAVVRTWNSRPAFSRNVRIERFRIIAEIKPKGRHAKKWFWVDQGTGGGRADGKGSPYIIRAKRVGGKPGLLRFRIGHNPRTLPIAKFNQGDGSSSGPFRSAREVIHPGIKARQFTKTWTDELAPEYRAIIERMFRQFQRRG